MKYTNNTTISGALGKVDTLMMFTSDAKQEIILLLDYMKDNSVGFVEKLKNYKIKKELNK